VFCADMPAAIALFEEDAAARPADPDPAVDAEVTPATNLESGDAAASLKAEE
jgi:hypothetical protein